MKNILVIILSLFPLYMSGASYKSPKIKGRLTDEKHSPLPYSTILLKNAVDSTLVRAETTDEKGDFVFENIKANSYYVEAQSLGYKKNKIPAFEIKTTDNELDLGTIQLQASSASLQTVTVAAEKPFIERQLDKTVVNIENSSVQTGTSVLDVMEKLPGVQVNQDGVISLKGKQGITIMMDGKPTVLSGEDLANMLKGMPSNTVQKVEIISNPSAKYEAAGNGGIINIVLKKNKLEGYNGSVTAGYGQGRYSKYNASVNLSYKNKWYNLYLMYGYSKRKGFNNLILTRNFYNNGQLNTVFETDDYIIFPFTTHTPRVGADFTLSKKSTLSILSNGVINHFEPTAANHTDILDGNKTKINSFDFTNNSRDKWYNYALNAQFRHQFDTAHKEVTFDIDYARYWNNTNQYFTNTMRDAEGNYLSNSILLGDQRGNLNIYSAKADYTQGIFNGGTFDAGWKSSYVTADNNVGFYNNSMEQQNFDSTRSNHFIYSENINALYLNLKKEFKKVSYQLGLRSEQTLAKGEQILTHQKFDRSYLQVFPSAFIDYKFTDKHSVSLNAGRRIDRPAYQQMNPFRRLIDATTYSEGNPYLLPQLTYNTEIGYTYNQSWFLTIGLSSTNNNITDVLIQDSQKKITVQSIVNLYRFNYYNINLTYSKKILKWWNTNTGVLAYYGKYSGTINQYNLHEGKPSFSITSANSFPVREGLSMETNLEYNYQTLYGVTTVKENYNLTIGLQKSVLEHKGTLTLNITDIFWRAYPSGITHFGNVDEFWNSKRDTRVANISFTYRFGKGQTGKIRRNTGADEEKRRTGGAN